MYVGVAQPSKRPHATMGEIARSFGRADQSKDDQLPQLLVEIAEQQKIDLSDSNGRLHTLTFWFDFAFLKSGVLQL